jgi:hypothetical protein
MWISIYVTHTRNWKPNRSSDEFNSQRVGRFFYLLLLLSALAANVVGKDLDVFAGGAVSLNHILQLCTKPFTMLLD